MVILILSLFINFSWSQTSLAAVLSEDESAMQKDGFIPSENQPDSNQLIESLQTEMLTVLCQANGDVKCLKALSIKSKMLSSMIAVNHNMAVNYSAKAAGIVATAGSYYKNFSDYLTKARKSGRNGRFFKGLQRLRVGLSARMLRRQKVSNWAIVAGQKISKGGQKALMVAGKAVGVLAVAADIFDFFSSSAQASPATTSDHCKHFTNIKIPAIYTEETLSCTPLYDMGQPDVFHFLEAPRQTQLSALQNPYKKEYYIRLLDILKKQNLVADEEIAENYKLSEAPKCNDSQFNFSILTERNLGRPLKISVDETNTDFISYEVSVIGNSNRVYKITIPNRSGINFPASVQTLQRFTQRGLPSTESDMGSIDYETWVSSSSIKDFGFTTAHLHTLPTLVAKMSGCCQTDNPVSCFEQP